MNTENDMGHAYRHEDEMEMEYMEQIKILCTERDELMAVLAELVERCDGDEGVRPDGSNIQTMRAHAILAKLTPVEICDEPSAAEQEAMGVRP